MALQSCTHLLFPVYASAGNKAEIDLTDIYIHHCDITKRTLAKHNLQFEDKDKMFHIGQKLNESTSFFYLWVLHKFCIIIIIIVVMH